MRVQKGMAMLEAALILTVLVPVLVICALVFEVGRLNSELREGVSTSLSEFKGVGIDRGMTVDPVAIVLGSVTEKLKQEMLTYEAEAVVGMLTYVMTHSGDIERMEFVSADCGVFYPAFCRNSAALRGPLEEKMKKFLSDHRGSLAVRDSDPFSGEPAVVTLPVRLVGVYVRMRSRGEIWRLIGFNDVGSYVDVVSPREEVAF